MKKVENNVSATVFDINATGYRDNLEFAIDARFQLRNRLDPAAVSDYTKAMAVGAKFPPIKLARIKGVLFLIDGFHRVAAAKEASYTLEATIADMTERGALREAAVTNLSHGVRLKASERINVFKAYIKGQGHVKDNGKLKSYREMASDLPGIGQYTTIRNWMFDHFPKIARQIGEEKPGNSRAEAPRIDPEQERAKQCREWIEATTQLLPAIGDPEMLHDLHRQVALLMEAFKGKTMIEPDF